MENIRADIGASVSHRFGNLKASIHVVGGIIFSFDIHVIESNENDILHLHFRIYTQKSIIRALTSYMAYTLLYTVFPSLLIDKL